MTAIDFTAVWKKYGRIWRTLSPAAHNNKFGMQMPLNITGDVEAPGPSETIKLFDLSREIDNSSSAPCGLIISLDLLVPVLDSPGNAGPGFFGELRVYADLRWSTGSGTNSARVDVTARGTVIAVVAADGLSIDVTRIGGPGASTVQNVVVRGTVGFAGSGGEDSAQLTIIEGPLGVLPIPPPTLIPKFARRVQVVSTAGIARLLFYSSPGSVPIISVPAPVGVGFLDSPIPNGALFFNIVGDGGSFPRAIFDLAI